MKTLTLFFCSLFMAVVAQAHLIHVPGDYSKIQSGINAATSGDTILVDEGIYREQINFLGKKPLIVASRYFIDGDTSHISKTIIDGSKPLVANQASVVYFVSGEDTTSVLCGFTIRNGRGTLNSLNLLQGGGIWISGSGAMIKNNRIINNKCEVLSASTYTGCSGGGIGIDSVQSGKWVIISDNLIGNNLVVTNKATGPCGGGGLASGANVKLINNIFDNNMAKRTLASTGLFVEGGGIYCYGKPGLFNIIQVVLTGNMVFGNQASGNFAIGGGMQCNLVLLKCSFNTFENNHVGTPVTLNNLAAGGMSVYNCLTGSTISNNIFKNNSSEASAGGLFIENNTSSNFAIRIEKNYFFENKAVWSGGALGVYDCPVMLVNNVFARNRANDAAAGYIESSVPHPGEHRVWLINNTFSYNKATNKCGAFTFTHTNPLILNSIFWKNLSLYSPEIQIVSGFAEIAYTNIDPNGINGTLYSGPGIITANPLFTDTINMVPEQWSPCVDAGTKTFTCMHNNILVAPGNDITNKCRPRKNGFDMGAFEPGYIIHVPAGFATIQLGIKAANAGDTVLVADGLYYEQINFLGKKPLMVASDFLMDGDISHISNTIIDGSQAANPDSASVVYFISGEDTTSVLCGFTVRGGKGTYIVTPDFRDLNGGGILVSGSGTTIRNNTIENNILDDLMSAQSMGGCGAGIASVYGYPGWTIVRDNMIRNNQITSTHEYAEGGGILCFATNVRITGNKISANLIKSLGAGPSAGGGLYCGSGEMTVQAIIDRNTFENNEAFASSEIYGGGVMANGVDLTFTNNILDGNKVIANPPFTDYYWGGGLDALFYKDSSLISGNVFRNNTCDGPGGGLDLYSATFTTILVEDNYFLGNEARHGGALDVQWDTTSNIRLNNNVFSHNHASGKGGAIWIDRNNFGPAEHMFISMNSSFYNNRADEAGEAIYVRNDNPVLLNSIFWHNQGVTGYEVAIGSGYAEIAYSDIDTAKISGNLLSGPGLINSDPLYNNPDLLTTQQNSPCVDAGTGSFTCNHGLTLFAPAYDITGIPRPVGGLYDMGAYDIIFSMVGMSTHRAGLPVSVWPNPVASTATFKYSLAGPSQVILCIFNGFGQLVAEPVNGFQPQGTQTFEWNAANLPSGIYFYRLTTGHDGHTTTGKLIVRK